MNVRTELVSVIVMTGTPSIISSPHRRDALGAGVACVNSSSNTDDSSAKIPLRTRKCTLSDDCRITSAVGLSNGAGAHLRSVPEEEDVGDMYRLVHPAESRVNGGYVVVAS